MLYQRLLACGLLLAALAWTQARPAARPALSDTQIEQSIRQRFAASKIARNGFRARVQGGVATLEGRTDIVQHKGTATRLAKAAGATRVVNRIEVSPAAREQAAKNLAKGRRRAQVKRDGTRRDERAPR